MYGDAATCDLCGADDYGLFVINDTNPLKNATSRPVKFATFRPESSIPIESVIGELGSASFGSLGKGKRK
jgi:hypothetical protein